MFVVDTLTFFVTATIYVHKIFGLKGITSRRNVVAFIDVFDLASKFVTC
jgi:hypothetical protein